MAAKTDDDTTCTGTMPAGRYWVGDLCYVLGDAWSGMWKYGDGVHTMPDGRCIAMFATIHGDGIYDDNQGNAYGVDSGSLGCILADDIRDPVARTDLGAFVTVTDPFTPQREYPPGTSQKCDGGVLHIAGVQIQLDREADDDEQDHGNGEGHELCPRCQFIDRVGDYLDAAAADGDEEWQDDVGPLIDRMHGALWAMQRLWSERFTAEHCEIDNTGEAARALVELYERIHALRSH